MVEANEDYNVVSRFVRGYEVVAADIAESEGDLNPELGFKLSRNYYTTDEQGSTGFISDRNQQIKNEYWYDAFGNILESKEQVHNRITYTGQQFDGITGQYYLRARFYNPVVGKFTQEDIYRGDGLNLYAYCGNNPVAYYDPSGYVVCESKKSAYKEYRKQGLTATEAWNKVKSEGVSNPESEVFYRTMSEKEYAKIEKNNMLTKREKGASELKVTTESDYVTNDLSKRKNQGKKYNQSVKFEVEGGTREALLKVGGTHSSAQKAFPDLPSFETGSGLVEVKYERNQVESLGLGTSEEGLKIFNDNIKSIHVFDSTNNKWMEIYRK